MSTFSQQVSVSGNDAEEILSSGEVSIGSSDLEVLHDTGSEQEVGLRFTSVTIPKNSTINSATIDFVVDVAQSGAVSVDIYGEDVDDASIFSAGASNHDISNRTPTTAKVTWSVGGSGSAANTVVTTSDISSVIQEIIERSGWVSGNDLAIILKDPNSTNFREFESFDGEAGDAPTLDVDYTPNAAPTVALNSPADTASTSDTTPVLEFTGTDGEGNDIRYEVQLASDSSFTTGAITKSSMTGLSVRQSGGDPTISTQITDENAIVAIVTTQDSNTNNLGAASVIRDGQSFTKLAEYGGSGGSGNPVNIQIWYLANPNTGTANTVADCNGTINECSMTVYRLAGCDVADLINTYNGASSSGSSPSVGVTTDEDDTYLIGGLVNEAAISGVGAGQDTDSALVGQSFENTTCTSKDGGAAGSKTLSFTSSSAAYAIAMVAINKGSGSGSIILDKVSGTDAGFANPDVGGDTDPFISGDNIEFTVQAGDALSPGTYYWRVRGIDPNGSSSYGAWSSTRSFTVTSGSSANSARGAHIVGKAAANSERDAHVTGKDTSNSERDAHVTGKDTSNSERSAHITGRALTNSARGAHIVGIQSANDERDAHIVGRDSANSSRSAHIIGKASTNSSRGAHIVGKASTSDTRAAHIRGGINVNDTRSAHLYGTNGANDERDAHIVGKLSSSSERDAHIRGGVNVNSERDAHLSGVATTSSVRSARVFGGIAVDSDAYVSDADPTTPHYTDTSMAVGYRPANNKKYRSYVKFDLSALPANAVIISAVFSAYMWHTDEDLTASTTMGVNRVTSSWDETLLTWNNQPSFDATAEDTQTFNGNTTGWRDFDVAQLVQDWIDGVETNNGLVIKQNSEAATALSAQFYTSNYTTNKALHPKLIVEYVLGANDERDAHLSGVATANAVRSAHLYSSNLITADKTANANNLVNIKAVQEYTTDTPFAESTKAANFSRSIGNLLRIKDTEHNGSLDISGDFTIELDIKLKQLPSTAGGTFVLVAKDNVSTTSRSYELNILDTDKLRVYFRDPSDNQSFFTCNTAFDAGDVDVWRHVAVTVDVSAPSAIFYIDGVAQTTTNDSVGATSVKNTDADFSIGARQTTGVDSDFLDAYVDNVRLWSDIRTAGEVADNRALVLNGDESNLVGYWTFEYGAVSSERGAHLVGKLSANDERDAHLVGVDTAADERDAHLTGVATAYAVRSAHIIGSTYDERGAHLVGTLTSSDERGAHLYGVLTASDERNAHLVGVDTDFDTRGAHLVGKLSANSSRGAHLKGTSFDYDLSTKVKPRLYGAVSDKPGMLGAKSRVEKVGMINQTPGMLGAKSRVEKVVVYDIKPNALRASDTN